VRVIIVAVRVHHDEVVAVGGVREPRHALELPPRAPPARVATHSRVSLDKAHGLYRLSSTEPRFCPYALLGLLPIPVVRFGYVEHTARHQLVF
jgi:hypothetical protein